jgi:tripartite-type tricarboxylate transporter receptor subunit TctC
MLANKRRGHGAMSLGRHGTKAMLGKEYAVNQCAVNTFGQICYDAREGQSKPARSTGRLKLSQLLFAAWCTASFACSTASHAQATSQAQATPQPQADYPARPVRIVVGFPPGQASDVIARALAVKLQNHFSQNFVVENKAGAGGILAQQMAATAPADGYTLLLTSAGPMAVNPGVYAKLPYDPLKDYAPVAGLISVPLIMVVNPSFPVKSVQDLVAMAKAKPGSINFGSAGNGVTNHLAMEMVAHAAGVKMQHVPYKGSPPALIDLMAGRINVMFDTPVAVLPFLRDGRLKAVAVGSPSRMTVLPDVATVSESGLPGFSAISWMVIVAPAKTPSAIVSKLSDAITKIVETPEMRKYFQDQGVEPMPLSVNAVEQFIKIEHQKWGKAAKEAGATVD